MFVFDKRLSAEQGINFKPSSKAPFGYMPSMVLATAGTTVANISCTDPTLVSDATTDSSGTAPAVAMLTRVRWDLGATDPVCLEGLITMATRQVLVGLLYAGLSDISVKFGARVFEYDPVITPKKYYCCFDTGITTPLVGKLLKDGDRELAIELGDEEALNIQDNSFYSFSMKIAPATAGQTITLASKSGGPITKKWGRTTG
jgi:hypothetical protein